MNMHIYAFGSLCRGEVDLGSDIDMLACVESDNLCLDKEKFSIYKYSRIEQLWAEGNPFSWHLHLESKLIYSSDNKDFIIALGSPAPYIKATEDCAKFLELFVQSYEAIISSKNSRIFNLSCMFLATRNFATCYSLGKGKPVFSRKSPFLIDDKLEIDNDLFNSLAQARILSTRGYGTILNEVEINNIINVAPNIINWMNRLSKVKYHD
jgi:hypothetical protein